MNNVDSLNHIAGLVKELFGKDPVIQAETMLRETRATVTAEVLSKNASNAIKASVTPQIKFAKNLDPDVLRILEAQQAKIQRLGLLVDEEAQRIMRQRIALDGKYDNVSMKKRGELYKKMEELGYDYLEIDTPIKLSVQTNEALLNIVNEYRPKIGTNSVYEKALQILKERGACSL